MSLSTLRKLAYGTNKFETIAKANKNLTKLQEKEKNDPDSPKFMGPKLPENEKTEKKTTKSTSDSTTTKNTSQPVKNGEVGSFIPISDVNPLGSYIGKQVENNLRQEYPSAFKNNPIQADYSNTYAPTVEHQNRMDEALQKKIDNYIDYAKDFLGDTMPTNSTQADYIYRMQEITPNEVQKLLDNQYEKIRAINIEVEKPADQRSESWETLSEQLRKSRERIALYQDWFNNHEYTGKSATGDDDLSDTDYAFKMEHMTPDTAKSFAEFYQKKSKEDGLPYSESSRYRSISNKYNEIYGDLMYGSLEYNEDFDERSGYEKGHYISFWNDEYTTINQLADFEKEHGVEVINKYATLNEKERKIYNYLYNTKGKTAANEYLKYIESTTLNKKFADEYLENMNEYGKEHPILGTGTSIAMSPFAAVTSLAGTVNSIATGEVDENNQYFLLARGKQEMRSAVIENHIDTATGKFIYSALTSAADSAVNALVAKGIVGGLAGTTLSYTQKANAISYIASGLMSSESAALSVLDAKRRGDSDEMAIFTGILRGGIEFLSEKIGLDNVMKNPKTFIKQLGKASIAEGSEEVVSSWANRLLDIVAYGGQSDIMQEYQKNIGLGMSRKEAAFNAFMVAVGEDLEAFLSGALSGGMMTAGGIGVNTAQHEGAIRSYGKSKKDKIIGMAEYAKETFGEDSDAYKKADEILQKTDKGEYVTDKEAGEFAIEFQNQFANDFQKENNASYNNEIINNGQVRYSISFNDQKADGEGKAVIKKMQENFDQISNEKKFDVSNDDSVSSYDRKSDYVADIFNKQGNIAHNPQIGNVELALSGAKSTILHGYGKIKLAAVKAIKNVIEKGDIIAVTENYNDSGVDRYIIAAKGHIDGKHALIGVVVKSYPNQKHDNKFYLHEAQIIEADSPLPTAPQLSVDTVGESASVDNSLSQEEPIVNTNVMQNGGNYTSNTAQNSSSGVDSAEYKGLIRSLGKNGQKAYADSVKSLIRNNPNASELEILRNFNRYYIGALVGKSRAEINENYADRVPDEVKRIAYNAGVADRKSEINNQRKMANSEVVKKGGLIENDYSDKLSDKQKEYISGLAKKLGVAVEVVDSVKTESGAEANGEYVNGIIRLSQKTINENPSEAVKFILAHEVSHRIKALAPKEFQKFSDLAVKYAAKKTGKSAVDIISDKVTERSKKGDNVDIPGATEEIAADVAGQFFDEGFLTYAAKENYTLMDKIRGYLFDLLDTLGIRKYTDVEALKRTWDKALQTAQNQVKKQSNYAKKSKVEGLKASERQVKYSITEIKGKNGNYGIGVKLDTDKFSNKKPRNWNKVLTEFVYKNLAGQTLEIQDEKGNRENISFAKLNERIKKDGAKNSHKVIDELARAKGNINTLSIVHIDELLETSKFTGSTDEHNHQWLDENGWIYRKAYVQDLNGNIYETTLNIAKARDGRNILYALSNTKKVDDGVVSSASNEEGLAHKHQLSKGSVPQQKQKVKPQNKKSVGEINPFEQENSFDNKSISGYNKESGTIDVTKIKYASNGLRLPKNEYAKVCSSISTNYYNEYKTHEGLQYQSCVTDSTHTLYIYEDGGFNHYNIVAKIDYAHENIANMIMEMIDDGRTRTITNLINRVLKSTEIRQSGYSVYNALTKKRIRKVGNAVVYSRQSTSHTRRTNGSGSPNNGNSGRDDRKIKNFVDATDTEQRNSFDNNIDIEHNKSKYPISEFDDVITYDEKRQLEDYITQKNNSNKKLKTFDCKEIGNNFYVWKNNGKYDYMVVSSLGIDGNEELIDDLRSDIKNGTYGTAKKLSEALNGRSAGHRDRNSNSDYASSERRISAGGNGGISSEQFGSNAIGLSRGSRENTSTDKTKQSVGPINPFEQAQADLEYLNSTYGVIEPGENAVRDVRIPKKNEDGTYNSRFSRTAAESAAFTDEQAAGILEAVKDGTFSYTRMTDKKARELAEVRLKKAGYKESLEQWNAALKGERALSKNEIAFGEYLLEVAAKKGEADTVVRLVAEIAAEGTRAGQVVQAMRLLKKMNGAGQLVYINRVVDGLQKDMDKRFGKKAPQIKVSENLKEKLVQSKSPESVREITDEILEEVAEQMPSTWFDKWNAWRYLAMLGNPRTHIRNIVGNAVFAPAVAVKNVIGAGLESAVDTVSKATRGKGIERTKTLAINSEYLSFANDDYAQVKDILSGGGKMNIQSKIDEKRRIFKSAPLEAMRNLNSNLLEAEDGIFLKGHYVAALSSYLAANKIDINSLTIDNKDGYKTLEKARNYAINEAKKATYRDMSKIANWLTSMSKTSKAGEIIIDAGMPFKKTPINILKRGIEYSPIYLVDTLARGSVKLANNDMSVSEFIDRLSTGLTGTGIMILGTVLANMGFLRGSSKDDEEDFAELRGEQAYSLQFGEHSYTIDWAAPVALPLFVGVELNRLLERDNMSIDVVLDSSSTLIEPIFEMSMLSGLNNILEAPSKNYDDKAVIAITKELIAGYLGQAVPTAMGQVTRTFFDDTARRTYTDKNNSMPDWIEYPYQKQANKVPLLSKNQEPYVDEWGREQKTESMAERFFENFISPGYYDKAETSRMENELIRLSKITDENVFPTTVSKKFTVNGTEKHLTAKEYTKYQKSVGQKSYKFLTNLTQNEKYADLTDEEKIQSVLKTYELAEQISKKDIAPEYKRSEWVNEALNAPDSLGMATDEFIMTYIQYGDTIYSAGAKAIHEKGYEISTFLEFKENIKDLKGEPDPKKPGEYIAGSKQKKIISEINKMDISNQEKAFLFSTQYESTKNNPWKDYLE